MQKNDITNSAGLELNFFTSPTGYTQTIDKPIHVVNNSISCIGLIFCTDQNVISKNGVDPSLFYKCHHDIIYGKINILVALSSIYVPEVWYYSKANVENTIANFNRNKVFENSSIDEKVVLWNETLLTIFRNDIPNKEFTCYYQ